MNDTPPQLIGKYEVLKELSEGGQGWVYLAADPNLRRHRVVLKVFKLTNVDDIERCRREADALAQLESYPGFVGIKDFFSHGDYWVLVLPFLEGRSLAERLRDEGPLPAAEAIRITLLLLRALQTAHERGIFHRDIKPSNIMLQHGEEVKLIDFGLAKSITDPDITDAGMLLGTARYMAPEQFPPIPPSIDYARVDIYQLGATLYHMLTARHAYDEEPQHARRPNPAELWMALSDAKRSKEPIPPSRHVPELSLELERIVLRAIAREPGERYATAAGMFEDLASLARGEGTLLVPLPDRGTGSIGGGTTTRRGGDSAAPVTRTTQERGWLRRLGFRRGKRRVLIVGAAVVLLTALGFFLLKPKSPQQSVVATTAGAEGGTASANGTPADGTSNGGASSGAGTSPDLGTADKVTHHPAKGSLNVISLPPKADIYLNGKDTRQQTNYTFEGLPAGEHALLVRLTIDGKTIEQKGTVLVVAGKLINKKFKFPPP